MSNIDDLKSVEQLQQQIVQLEMMVKQYLDRDAVERYNNLKSVHQELAMQVLVSISQLVQSGQLQQKVSDEQFKEILTKLSPQRRNFNIMRK